MCVKSISRVFPKVSSIFKKIQGCFKIVLRVLEGSLEGVEGSFKGFLQGFGIQRSFKVRGVQKSKKLDFN